ncbi:MAG: WG repeat-containing protein, partial [Calditrichota bacterium]
MRCILAVFVLLLTGGLAAQDKQPLITLEKEKSTMPPVASSADVQVDYVGRLRGNRALYRVDHQNYSKYGYLDEKGDVVIEARFNSAGKFFEGMAKVQTGQFSFRKSL